MTPHWFYVKNGQRLGPFGLTQLKQLVAAGLLGETDLVWQEGYQEWVAAGSVADLFPIANVLPVPAPARPSVPPPLPPQSPASPPPSQPIAAPTNAAGLVSCPKCKKPVADTAETCPHCGAEQDAKTKKEIVGPLFVFITIATIWAVQKLLPWPIYELSTPVWWGLMISIVMVSLLLAVGVYELGKYLINWLDRRFGQ